MQNGRAKLPSELAVEWGFFATGIQRMWVSGAIQFVPPSSRRGHRGQKRRKFIGVDGSDELRDPMNPYDAVYDPKNVDLKAENTYYWDITG